MSNVDELPTPLVNHPVIQAEAKLAAETATQTVSRDTSEAVQAVPHDAPEERRRHPRAPLELLVGLRFDSVQHFLASYAEDISESGMFLRSEHAGALRSVGEELELRFDAGDRRIVQGRGRVVRVIETGEPGSTAGIGIEFVELDESSRKLVEAIVRIKLASVRGG
jgi:Tfp pilus assembly protein PilZ